MVEVQCERAEAAVRILEELPDVIKVEQTAADRLEVFAPALPAGRINQTLVDNGITAEQIVVRRETLEQVFFRLTGRTSADVNDGGGAD